MELSAFAHLTRRNVKVIQPGLVYVIEWAAGEGTSPTTSGQPSAFTHSSLDHRTLAKCESIHSPARPFALLLLLEPLEPVVARAERGREPRAWVCARAVLLS
jgi:hypothetical protein